MSIHSRINENKIRYSIINLLIYYDPITHLLAYLLTRQRREFAAIEFDNKLLLERLAKVVQQKTIDNEIHKSVEFHGTYPFI